VRGLGGLSGLAEVGERSRLDRWLGHARRNESRTELLAALRIIKPPWLAGRVAFVDRRLVLEVLHGGEGQYLGRV